MSKKQYYFLFTALFASIAILGWVEGGFFGALRTVALGVVGFVIGKALRDDA